ncbi:cytochrome o ubiquinol oxidase subunit III, partial [Vibrio parahaemolyticus]
SLKFVLGETFLLLVSSITYGFAMIAMHKGKIAAVNLWLFATFLLGLGFVIMEVYEFHELIAEGFGPDRSGF